MTQHRKQLKRYEIESQPRFLTFSCHHRLQLLSNDRIKMLVSDHLRNARTEFDFKLLAWVIMPEHVHLLLVPNLPVANITSILQSLKGHLAGEIIARWKALNAPILHRLKRSDGRYRFWLPGGGFDRNVRDEEEMFNIISYIHGNPVKRGLVELESDWVWSSALWYAGERERALIPIDSVFESPHSM